MREHLASDQQMSLTFPLQRFPPGEDLSACLERTTYKGSFLNGQSPRLPRGRRDMHLSGISLASASHHHVRTAYPRLEWISCSSHVAWAEWVPSHDNELRLPLHQ